MRRQHNNFIQPGYVTSGLILHLDALYNMGVGNDHSNSTTTWYDLSASGNNFSLINPSWGSNYLNFTGATRGQSINTINLSTYNKLTIEVFLKSIGSSVGVILEQTSNYNSFYGAFIIVTKDGSPTVRDVNFGIRKNVANGYLYGGINSFTENLFQAVYDDTIDIYNLEMMMFKDAVQQTVLWNTNAISTNATVLQNDIVYLGARNGSSLFFNGSIRSIRIYNRALSAEELLQNKSEDYFRFGI